MTRQSFLRSQSVRGLVAYVIAASALVLSPRLGGALAEPWSGTKLLFGVVVVGAGLCAVAAAVLLWLAHRRGAPEQGLLGALLWAVSVLPLTHGLTIPGVLMTDNGATTMSVLLAIPCGAVAAVPLLAPSSRLGVWLARHWRPWALANVAAGTAVAVALVAAPTWWAHVDAGHPATLALAAISVVSMGALASRHLRLYVLGRHTSSLVAAYGFANIAVTGLVWLAPVAWSPGWWAVHLLDISGVFAAIFGLMACTPRERTTSLLDPVLNFDPLVALELGLSPVIREFVARLGAKDAGTRDHVIRAAELAIRLGVRAGLDVMSLRTLGLAALLHDVGKVGVDDAVLAKPGTLTDEEYEHMKTHSRLGWEMLQGEPLLAHAAPLVRGHHERPDGLGYPDGLAGDEISLEQGIISAVDAYDAMTQTRHYREGLAGEVAVEQLLKHAGSQFHTKAVALLLEHLDEHGGPASIGVFEEVDRPVCHAMPVGGV